MDDPPIAGERDHLPEVLEVSFLLLPGFVETGMLFDDTLMFYRGDEQVELSPGRDAWLRFWTSLEQGGVWRWQREYDDPSVLDGEQWSVKILRRERWLESRGNNAWPPGFAGFRHELDRLVRGRFTLAAGG